MAKKKTKKTAKKAAKKAAPKKKAAKKATKKAAPKKAAKKAPKKTGAREAGLPPCPGFLCSHVGDKLGNTTFEPPDTVPTSSSVTPIFECRRFGAQFALSRKSQLKPRKPRKDTKIKAIERPEKISGR